MHHASHAPFSRGGRVDRIALLSVHTCPLDQPGTGDAGGMNVYLREVARRLGEMGVEVDVFTRDAGCPAQIAWIGPGARVIHLPAGPRAPLAKDDVPGVLDEFTVALTAFARAEGVTYDAVHAHYWMSGRVGRLVAHRWGVPFLQTFHTLGKVKNMTLAEGDLPEPRTRIAVEERIVAAADQILTPTLAEAEELASFYAANPARLRIVSPGVDTDVFTPGPADRGALGWPLERPVVLFVGRLQPLKSPEVAVRAAAVLAADRVGGHRPVLAIVGGPSGALGCDPGSLRALATSLGLGDDELILSPPLPHASLVDAYRAATVTLVPSRTESFGLVALESQACGTPVVASDVGGLRTAVRHDDTGLLVPVGDVAGFVDALATVIDDEEVRARLSAHAIGFARRFDWRWVARGLLSAYEDAVAAGARADVERVERDA
jgi:D-inositol-3-phosphate glycosyltransferase